MKKILFLIFVFTIFTSINMLAQKIISKGVIGGLSIANVYGDDIKDNSFRTGFSIGAFATIGLSERFSIRPEIHYSSKGFSSESEDKFIDATGNYSVDNEGSLSLNYIEIPLFAVFSINKNFHIFGGPYMDIFLNGEAEQTSEGFFTYDNGTEITKTVIYESGSDKIESDAIRSPGYGVTIGTEYIISQVSFGARYSLGLSQIPDAGNVSFKHTNIQFMVGYYLK